LSSDIAHQSFLWIFIVKFGGYTSPTFRIWYKQQTCSFAPHKTVFGPFCQVDLISLIDGISGELSDFLVIPKINLTYKNQN